MRNPFFRRAATSVDLLTAGTGILIGVALLVPGLARTREGANAASCVRNLKQLGYGLSLYVADQGGSLPGPTTIQVPYDAARKYVPVNPGLSEGLNYYKHMFTSYVSPYVGGGTPADLLAFCPTADAIPVKSSAGQSWYYQMRVYYVLNSYRGTTFSNIPIKHATSPGYYFGTTLVNQRNWSAYELPKPLERVNNPSREWALADIWYWEAVQAGGRGNAVAAGTWGYTLASAYAYTGAIINNGLKIPSYPFHNTNQTYMADPYQAGIDRTFGSPRLTTGETNNLYFDGHAGGVRNWTGTVNPCLELAPCD